MIIPPNHTPSNNPLSQSAYASVLKLQRLRGRQHRLEENSGSPAVSQLWSQM